MTPNRRNLSIALIAFSLAAGCSRNPDPNATPQTRTGQIATLGRTFLLSVEEAQKSLIQLSDANTVKKDDAVKVMEVFKQIGQAGQQLSDALQLLSTTNGTEAERNTLDRVSTIMTNIATLLDTSLVPVGDANSRETISKLLQGISKALIQVGIELAKQ